MNITDRWIFGLPTMDIASLESLKHNVKEHAKRDYLFFPFLIGHVAGHLKEENITDNVRNCLLQVLYELMLENEIVVLFVSETTLKAAHWKDQKEIIQILEQIKLQWELLPNGIPEMNQVIWLTTISDLVVSDKNNQVIIKFRNFKRKYVGESIFIEFYIGLTYSTQVAGEVYVIELAHLNSFLSSLKEATQKLKQTSCKYVLSEIFYINFEIIVNEDILVNGSLKTKSSPSPLNFSFVTTFKQLTRMVNESENLCEVLS